MWFYMYVDKAPKNNYKLGRVKTHKGKKGFNTSLKLVK